MDNANKAIIMAFGMLVAVMILGTVVFVFTRLSSLPVQDDSIEEIEQRRLFNQEYEVYDKKIMYGVDVISVLNKAQSNNEKYVKGKFFSGIGYNTDYIINIVVKLKTALQENVRVTYVQTLSNGVVETEYANGYGPTTGPILSSINGLKKPSSTYQSLIYVNNFWNQPLASKAEDTKVTAGVYQLLSGATEPMSNINSAYRLDDTVNSYTDLMIEGNTVLKQLLTQSATMRQTVRNTGSNTGNGGWSQATWYPAIYDLKTRKFRCEGERTVYSEKTGRIVYMEFSEV